MINGLDVDVPEDAFDNVPEDINVDVYGNVNDNADTGVGARCSF